MVAFSKLNFRAIGTLALNSGQLFTTVQAGAAEIVGQGAWRAFKCALREQFPDAQNENVRKAGTAFVEKVAKALEKDKMSPHSKKYCGKVIDERHKSTLQRLMKPGSLLFERLRISGSEGMKHLQGPREFAAHGLGHDVSVDDIRARVEQSGGLLEASFSCSYSDQEVNGETEKHLTVGLSADRQALTKDNCSKDEWTRAQSKTEIERHQYHEDGHKYLMAYANTEHIKSALEVVKKGSLHLNAPVLTKVLHGSLQRRRGAQPADEQMLAAGADAATQQMGLELDERLSLAVDQELRRTEHMLLSVPDDKLHETKAQFNLGTLRVKPGARVSPVDGDAYEFRTAKQALFPQGFESAPLADDFYAEGLYSVIISMARKKNLRFVIAFNADSPELATEPVLRKFYAKYYKSRRRKDGDWRKKVIWFQDKSQGTGTTSHKLWTLSQADELEYADPGIGYTGGISPNPEEEGYVFYQTIFQTLAAGKVHYYTDAQKKIRTPKDLKVGGVDVQLQHRNLGSVDFKGAVDPIIAAVALWNGSLGEFTSELRSSLYLTELYPPGGAKNTKGQKMVEQLYRRGTGTVQTQHQKVHSRSGMGMQMLRGQSYQLASP